MSKHTMRVAEGANAVRGPSWAGKHDAPRGIVASELRKRVLTYSGQETPLLLLNLLVWDRSDLVVLKMINPDRAQIAFFTLPRRSRVVAGGAPSSVERAIPPVRRVTGSIRRFSHQRAYVRTLPAGLDVQVDLIPLPDYKLTSAESELPNQFAVAPEFRKLSAEDRALTTLDFISGRGGQFVGS